MEVIYGIIPGVLLLGLVMVGLFFWAARSGQFDDLEGDAQRILMDEDLSPTPPTLAEREEESDAQSVAETEGSAAEGASGSADAGDSGGS